MIVAQTRMLLVSAKILMERPIENSMLRTVRDLSSTNPYSSEEEFVVFIAIKKAQKSLPRFYDKFHHGGVYIDFMNW